MPGRLREPTVAERSVYVAGGIVGLVSLLAFRVREEPRFAPELA